MTAPTTSRPAATVLRSPSTNHPRIHRTDRATFEAEHVLVPACASAESRRDALWAAICRGPRYRSTCATITCQKHQCTAEDAGDNTVEESSATTSTGCC
jgi:hypothetical protein